MNNGLPGTLVFQLAGTPDDAILFAATEIGPYGFSKHEQEWYLLSGLSAPDQTYWTVDYIPEINTARFGTYGRGIWDFILDENFDLISGDINDDTLVNIQDIILLIQFILDTLEPSGYQNLAADMNSDGELNVSDIILVMNIILNR